MRRRPRAGCTNDRVHTGHRGACAVMAFGAWCVRDTHPRLKSLRHAREVSYGVDFSGTRRRRASQVASVSTPGPWSPQGV